MPYFYVNDERIHAGIVPHFLMERSEIDYLIYASCTLDPLDTDSVLITAFQSVKNIRAFGILAPVQSVSGEQHTGKHRLFELFNRTKVIRGHGIFHLHFLWGRCSDVVNNKSP